MRRRVGVLFSGSTLLLALAACAIAADQPSSPAAEADATQGAVVAAPTFRSTAVATAGALPSAAALTPGRYDMPNPYADQDPVRSCELGCADYRWITFDLPEGWVARDSLIHKHLGEAGEVAFSVWTPGMVYADACHWRDSPTAELLDVHDHSKEPALGSTALMHQRGRVASSATEVTLGGQLALRIELAIPADLDLASCDDGEFRSWTEWDVDGGRNAHHAPGQIDVIYIIDVDRRPFVIDASHMPGASLEDLAELEAILASALIYR